MAFRGWPLEALEFFERLEADNSKTYWQRNKDVYERLVRAPTEELLEELAPEFGEGRVFRLYRDIRFSFGIRRGLYRRVGWADNGGRGRQPRRRRPR